MKKTKYGRCAESDVDAVLDRNGRCAAARKGRVELKWIQGGFFGDGKVSSEKTDAERIIEAVKKCRSLTGDRACNCKDTIQKILDERDAEMRKKTEEQDLALKFALRKPCYHPAQYVSNWVEDDGKRICLECEITRLKSGDVK